MFFFCVRIDKYSELIAAIRNAAQAGIFSILKFLNAETSTNSISFYSTSFVLFNFGLINFILVNLILPNLDLILLNFILLHISFDIFGTLAVLPHLH
jgi:hypothetical protein